MEEFVGTQAGVYVQGGKMKRLFAIFCGFALVAVACGGDESSQPEGTGVPATTSPASTETSAPAGGQVEFDSSKVFRMAMTAYPDSIDPIRVGADAHAAFLKPVYEALTSASDTGETLPGLASSWELQEGATILIMNLLQNVKFQDGTPFDAAAVVANLNRNRGEGSRVAQFLTLIDSVDEVDQYTVEIRMNRPGGDLPGILRTYAGMMVSPGAFDNPDLGTNPVGTGPFRVVNFGENRIAYEPWPEYRDADQIRIAGLEVHSLGDDTARYNAVRSGQLDSIVGRPDQVAQAQADGLGLVTADRVLPYGIFLNTSRSEFAAPQVRKALMYAIDRNAISQFLFDDKCAPAAQLYPPSFWAYNPDLDYDTYAGYDPEKARALLAEVGLEDGFSFTLTTSSITAYQRMSEAIQAQLAEVGIDITINVSEVNLIIAGLANGEFDAAIRPLFPANPDPTAYIFEHLMPGGTGNTSGFEIPGIAEELAAARSKASAEEQAPHVREISRLALEAGSRVIPICMPFFALITSPAWENVPGPALGDFDFSRVYFRTS